MMEIKFTQTLQHVNDFAVHHWRKHTLRRFLGIFLIIFALLTVVGLMNNKEAISAASVLSYLIPMVLILVIWIGIMPMLIKMRFKRNKDQNVWTGERTISLEEDKILLQTPEVKSEYHWSMIKKVEITKLCYLLYISSIQAIIIPRDSFLTDTEREAFELILKEKGKF